jgi:hypothetical protein
MDGFFPRRQVSIQIIIIFHLPSSIFFASLVLQKLLPPPHPCLAHRISRNGSWQGKLQASCMMILDMPPGEI